MSEVRYKAVKEKSENSCDGCIHENGTYKACLEFRSQQEKDCKNGYIYQLDTSNVTLEQAREKFVSGKKCLTESLIYARG